jgi:phage gp16-like protein
MIAASPRQIGAIHAIAAKIGLDEDTRRDLIERETGKRSSKDLSWAEAGRIIEHLKGLAPVRTKAKGAVDLTGHYAAKLRALWISGWHLGIVRDRTDKALLSFVERQTGLSHVRFLHDPADANKAIEGLKAWLARAAGVVWPKGREDDVGAAKLAVIAAQRRRLAVLGIAIDDCGAAREPLDDEMRAHGRVLRDALAHREKRAGRTA